MSTPVPVEHCAFVTEQIEKRCFEYDHRAFKVTSHVNASREQCAFQFFAPKPCQNYIQLMSFGKLETIDLTVGKRALLSVEAVQSLFRDKGPG